MSATLLEVTRASHEEVERLERTIVKDLQTDPTSNKDRLFQSHRVRNMIDQISDTTYKLIEIYEDKDSARKDEIAALGGQMASGNSVFSAFYDRLKEIREYHRRNPTARIVDSTDEYEQMLKEEPHVEFSGEEGFGRYLDLHELYNDYINSKFGEPIEYSAYLEVFSHAHKIPRKLKLTRQYKEYLTKLLDYLIYFFERTEPLQDLEKIFSKVTTELDEQWASGMVQGWENDTKENGHDQSEHATIDVDYYSTVEELTEVGPERLKEVLVCTLCLVVFLPTNNFYIEFCVYLCYVLDSGYVRLSRKCINGIAMSTLQLFSCLLLEYINYCGLKGYEVNTARISDAIHSLWVYPDCAVQVRNSSYKALYKAMNDDGMRLKIVLEGLMKLIDYSFVTHSKSN